MPNTVEFYLSKGFDRTMAEYYAAGTKRLTDIEPHPNFTLVLTYENEIIRVYDVKPLLDKGGVFTPLREYEIFERVYIDDCGNVAWDIDPDVNSNIVWGNKVDIGADVCFVNSVPVSEYKAVM